MSDQDPTRIDLPATPDDATRVQETVVDHGGGEPPIVIPPSGPLPPPPDRRPWIIAGLLALIVVVLILILVLQDDDDDGDTETAATTSSLVTTTTAASTTTAPSTTTTAPTTTTSPVVTVPPDECAELGKSAAKPGQASDTVHEAWIRGDKDCAATLMTPAALNELFSRPGKDANEEFQGCTGSELPDPQADCAYTYEGGATHYVMSYSALDGWKVTDITQVAD